MQGAKHAKPLWQMPPHLPLAMEAQADPGGNPRSSQSASRWQTAQSLTLELPSSAQKLLPAVVVRHAQLESLQKAGSGSGAEQKSGAT